MERKRARRASEDAIAAVDPGKTTGVAVLKLSKATRYAGEFSGLGWSPEISQTDALVELVAKRGTEALYLAWLNEAHVSGTSTYTISDRTVKVRNPAEAMRIAALKPEEAQAKQAKVGPVARFRKAKVTGPTIRNIPFNIDTATDEEIISALESRRISWHNSYRMDSETATIGRARRIEITRHPDGHRIVSFVDPESGFRAFRLDALENVGRKADLLKIQQGIISSLSQKDKSKGKAA